MSGLSPLASRLLALALLAAAVLLLASLTLAPMLSLISEARSELALLNQREAVLQHIAMEPATSSRAARGPAPFLAGNSEQAKRVLTDLVRSSAASHGIEVGAISITRATNPRLPQLAATVSLFGETDAITAYLSELESGSPVLRADQMTIASDPGQPGRLRMNLRLVAVARGAR